MNQETVHLNKEGEKTMTDLTPLLAVAKLLPLFKMAKSYVDEHMCYDDGHGCSHCGFSDRLHEAILETADLAPVSAELMQALDDLRWKPIESAPVGYENGKFNYVEFKGCSSSGAFSGTRIVSGYMDSAVDYKGRREPVHFYHYKLNITSWRPIKSLDDYPLVKAYLEGDV